MTAGEDKLTGGFVVSVMSARGRGAMASEGALVAEDTVDGGLV